MDTISSLRFRSSHDVLKFLFLPLLWRKVQKGMEVQSGKLHTLSYIQIPRGVSILLFTSCKRESAVVVLYRLFW